MAWAMMKVSETTHAGSMREGYFRIAIWLSACRGEVTAKQVQARFPELDRATTYRIVADWKRARGISA